MTNTKRFHFSWCSAVLYPGRDCDCTTPFPPKEVVMGSKLVTNQAPDAFDVDAIKQHLDPVPPSTQYD